MKATAPEKGDPAIAVVEANLGRSFNLMALVIYDDACLEPRYLRFIAAGGPAHAFAPRALKITVLGCLTCLPQVDTAADALVVVKKLLADQAGNILKASRSLFDVLLPFLARHFGRELERNYSSDHGNLSLFKKNSSTVIGPRQPTNRFDPYKRRHIRGCSSASEVKQTLRLMAGMTAINPKRTCSRTGPPPNLLCFPDKNGVALALGHGCF